MRDIVRHVCLTWVQKMILTRKQHQGLCTEMLLTMVEGRTTFENNKTSDPFNAEENK